MFLRFLRGRKWDLEAAYDMYIQTCSCFSLLTFFPTNYICFVALWRKSFQGIGVEGVTEETVENELKSAKCFMYEYDKSDRTIIYVRPRLHDPSSSKVEEV